jgi:hypothetical protein
MGRSKAKSQKPLDVPGRPRVIRTPGRTAAPPHRRTAGERTNGRLAVPASNQHRIYLT